MTFEAIKKVIAESEIPQSMDLSPHGHIFDLPKFIESHMAYLEGNSGNNAFRPYFDRLRMVAIKLKNL